MSATAQKAPMGLAMLTAITAVAVWSPLVRADGGDVLVHKLDETAQQLERIERTLGLRCAAAVRGTPLCPKTRLTPTQGDLVLE